MAKIFADFFADTIKDDSWLILLIFDDLSKSVSADFVGEWRLLDENAVLLDAQS